MALSQRLTNKELKEMANTMSGAFLYHTNFVHLIPKENSRKKALYQLFMMMLPIINKNGFIFKVESEHKVVGYITYMDDSKYSIGTWSVIKNRVLHRFLLFAFHAGISNLLKFNSYMKLYDEAHQSHTKNSIHLYQAGMDSEYRGKGLMNKEMLLSFDYMKEIGYSSIQLETSDPSNFPIYLHLGFEVINELQTTNKEQTIKFFEKKIG